MAQGDVGKTETKRDTPKVTLGRGAEHRTRRPQLFFSSALRLCPCLPDYRPESEPLERDRTRGKGIWGGRMSDRLLVPAKPGREALCTAVCCRAMSSSVLEE